MKAPTTLFFSLLAIVLIASPAQAAPPATYWWNKPNGTGSWSTNTNWWTSYMGSVNPASAPTSIDSVVFSGNGINGSETISFGSDTAISGITFGNTGTTTIKSGNSTSRTLTIGAEGITVNSTANAVTIGNATNNVPIVLGAAQTWTNNSSQPLTVVNNVDNGGNLLSVAGSGNTEIKGILSGAGGLNANLSQTSLLTLSGANTFQGPVTISGDNQTRVAATNATALGQVGNNVSVQGNGALVLQAASGGSSITYANYSLTLGGGGTQYGALYGNTGATTWTGNINLTDHSKITTSSQSKGLTLSGSIDTDGKTVTFNPDAAPLAQITVSGEIKSTTGTGSVVVDGPGTVNFSAVNSYNGDTTIKQGTLKAGIDNALPNGTGKGNVVLDGGAGKAGTLDLNGHNVAINGLSGTSAGPGGVEGTVVNNGADKTLSVGNGNASAIFAGNIADGTGKVSISKEGTGTQTLGGLASNTYTGTTTVNGGTLALNKNSGVDAVGPGEILLNSGGTLLLQNADQINNAANLTLNGGTFSTGTGFNETLGIVTLTKDSSLSLGNSIHLLQFGDSSLTAWSPTAKLTIYGWSGFGGSEGYSTLGQIFFGSNSLTLAGDQLANINFNGFDPGAMLLSTGELVPTAVPETGTYVAGLLLVGLVAWRERKRLALMLPVRF